MLNRSLTLLLLPALMLLVYACGEKGSELEQKKAELKAKKEQAVKLQAEIADLEREVISLDPSYLALQRNATLVSTNNPKKGKFVHKIEVRGSVDSRSNIVVSPQVMSKITSVKVRNGQTVKQGDVIITLDAAILRNSIEETKSQLDLAETLYKKQKRLWESNIGTEVQYLQAKTNYENLQRRLATQNSQLSDYVLRAPVDGQVNDLESEAGEMASVGMPLFRVVNGGAMYVKSDISEAYVGKFNVGDTVEINIPSIGVKTQSTIYSIGQVINQENRTFRIRVGLPSNVSSLKANQVAVLTVQDYANPVSVMVPTKVIQFDNFGNYVFVTEKSEDALKSKKMYIDLGKTYQGTTEIIKGLDGSENLIIEGYRDINNGSYVKIES